MAAFSRTLLAKLLGKLGSDQDGEVLAFARKAHGLVRDAGLTWEQVLETAGPASAGRRGFSAPDAPVVFAGAELRPPYGTRWIETVHRLLQEGPALAFTITEADRLWLRAMPGRLAQRGIQGHEAANLCRVWNEAHNRYRTQQEAAG